MEQNSLLSANFTRRLYPLNHEALRQMIRDLKLKRDFIATSIQVTPLTINRWTTGKTATIQHHHLIKLASLLACDPNHLIRKAQLTPPFPILRRRILNFLENDATVGTLATLEQYDLIEACLEISYSEDFTQCTRAKVFYFLAVCNYKQEKYDAAINWLKNLFDLTDIKDADFEFKAEQLMASIYLLKDDYSTAEGWFAKLFKRDLTGYSDETKSLLYSNYGYFHFRKESYKKAVFYIEKSIELVNFDIRNKRQALNRCSSLRLLIECSLKLDKRCLFDKCLFQLNTIAQVIDHSYSLYRVDLFKIDEKIWDYKLEQAFQDFWDLADRFPQHLDWYFLTKGHRLNILIGKPELTDELWPKVLNHPSCKPAQWQQDLKRISTHI